MVKKSMVCISLGVCKLNSCNRYMKWGKFYSILSIFLRYIQFLMHIVALFSFSVKVFEQEQSPFSIRGYKHFNHNYHLKK